MKPSPRRPLGTLLSVTVLMLVLTPGVRALEPDGALARWIDRTLAPQLAEALARHPSLRGETVGFTTVVDGAPSADSTVLGEAVEQRLRQHLLGAGGVRLAVDRPPSACPVPSRLDLLVGIEITATSSRSARLAVGVVDVAGGVWVAGVGDVWVGDLSRAEAAALGARVSGAPAGSAASPLPASGSDRIAAALVERLRCSRPAGLDGRTHLPADPGGTTAPVALALRGALAVTPLVVLTPAAEGADWLLHVEAGPDDDTLRELRLLLSDADGDARQQLASVFVRGPAGSSPVARAPEPVVAAPRTTIASTAGPASRPVAAPVERPLLGALQRRRVAATGVCDGAGPGDRTCVELWVDVLAPAWVFVLSTRGGELRALSCDVLPGRSEPGEKRWRLDVRAFRDREPGAPDAGLYVFATADRDRARALGALLAAAPGACRGGSPSATARWLDELGALLARPGPAIDWRATQLRRQGRHLVAVAGR